MRKHEWSRRLPAAGWVIGLLAGLAGPVGRGVAQDGLVLSGGGSRGLAHAGAIVGLERLGLDPDLVVGASMGAIIGGLYASGMAADSIWSLTRTQNWQEMFSPSVVWTGPEGAPRRPMTRLGLGVDRTRFPDGIIPDWRVNRVLVRLFLDPAFRARGDFDALPRRFRSMTADLRTGESVVIANGDLARAIRASMAVPGVFAPVVLDGVPLVDGGLADYLPVGPARRAGADRVVAVDVIRPPPDDVGLNPLQVALRSFRMTLNNARLDKDTADVEIAPDIDPDLFAAVFLRDPAPLLEAGLAAALALPDRFDDDRTTRRPQPAPTTFAGLRVETNDPALDRLVRQAFDPVAARGYDREAILDAVDGLYSTGLFTGIWPRLESDGVTDTLVVLAQAYAPATVMGAVGYDTDRGFRGWAELTRRIGGRFETSLAGNVGDIAKWAVASLRYRPSDRQPALVLDGGASVEGNDVRFFSGDEPVGESRIIRTGGWFGLGWRRLEPDVETTLQVTAEHIDTGLRDGFVWGPTFRLSRPTDNASIVGTPVRLDAAWRMGDFDYHRLRAAGSVGFQSGPLRAAVTGDVTVVRGDGPVDVWPALGDAHAMPGLRWGRARARSMAIGGVDVALATPLESHVRLRLRAGTVADDPADLDRTDWITGAEVALLWWTPVGGLTLHAGVAEGGTWLFGLDIGPLF